MARVNTGLFIARRISSPEGGRKNVMVCIATLTVAVGMAVMIVALAVIGGFKREITEKLVGVGSHVRITGLYGGGAAESPPVTVDSLLMDDISHLPRISSIGTYAVKGGIMRTDEAIHGIALKGIGEGYDTAFLEASLIEGALPVVGDTVRHKDILISRRMADMLRLGMDDRVEVLFAAADRPVRRDRFKVSGIYATGMDELDKTMAFTDIRNVQRLNGWAEDEISGYEIMTTDFSRLDEFGDSVYDTVVRNADRSGDVLRVDDVVSLNPGIFDWMAAHNVNAVVIIVIMLLVSLLNMISALLIILLEKTSMIGILKALGMTNGGVQKIFLLRSLRIVLAGMVWGNIAGIGLAALQKYTHLVKLESAGYMLDHVPVQFGWEWLVGLNVGVPLLMVLLLSIPALAVSAVKPEKTIRYQ